MVHTCHMVLSVSLLTNCYTWKLMTRESITIKERLLLSPASIHLNCPYQLSISRAIDWYTSYTKRSRGTVNVTKSKRLATMRRVASPSFHTSINKTEPQSKNVSIKMNYPFLAPSMWIQIIYVLQKKKDALFKYITVLTRYSIHSFEFTTTVAVGFDPALLVASHSCDEILCRLSSWHDIIKIDLTKASSKYHSINPPYLIWQL